MEIVLPVLGIAGGLFAGSKQKEAYDEAAGQTRDMAKRNAQRIEQETQESVRQQRDERDREQATARAAAGASGALVTSKSHEDYGQGLWDSRQKEIDWTIRSGESRKSIALSEGEWGGRVAEAEGEAAWWSSVSSGVSSAGSFLG